MRMRTRKLIGTIMLLLFLVFWAVLTLVVASALAVRTTSSIVSFLFYAGAGLGWVLPAGWILKWTYRPVRDRG